MINNWREKLEVIYGEVTNFIKDEILEGGKGEIKLYSDEDREGDFYGELPRVNAETRRGDLEEYAVVKVSLSDGCLLFDLLSIDTESEDEEKQVSLSSLDISNLMDIADFLEYLKSN